MFRSSVAAFYALPECLFYRVGGFHWGRLSIVFMRPSVLCEVKKIVDRMSEILFAAQIAFRCLDGCMPQQELNLLQLATAAVAHLVNRFAASHAGQCVPIPLSHSRS